MISPERFLKEIQQPAKGKIVALGTIPADYVSGRPKVIFDGEQAASSRAYPYLASYTPAQGDRVELLLVGHTWVIQGKII